MPGVGEALKREIAGLVLVDRLLLWGFAQCGCFRPELTRRFGGAHWFKHSADFACFRVIRMAFCRRHHVLPCRSFDQSMPIGSQEVWPATGRPICDVRPGHYAAVLAVAGGALGCWADAIVSMMINCPPQHGQGSAKTRGSSVLLGLSPSSRLWFGVLAPSNRLILAILAARLPFPKNP